MTRVAYERVKDLLSEEEFDARVEHTLESWGGLIDPAVAARLVLDALGRLEPTFDAIGDLEDGREVTLRATVERVFPSREFLRSDGSRGRVANVGIRDDTGRCLLVLWDADVDLIDRQRLRPGVTLRAVDCYVRRTNFGLEVSRGRYGTLALEE